MIGETALAGVITGLIQQHKIDKWARLLIGLTLSGACTFSFTWGSFGITHILAGTAWPIALALGFCEGLITAAAITFWKFSKDPLAKNISLSVPAGVEMKAREILQHDGVTTVEGKK